MLKPGSQAALEDMNRAIRKKGRSATIGLDAESSETIVIGMNEHIGTDPTNLLLALATSNDGKWKAWAILPIWDDKSTVAARQVTVEN